ncbi:MAG: MBL fold metallo-hydrolase [Ardenticatenaceae bacterium]
MSNKMSITFWGVRGSYPTPGPSTMHYGGNTSCIEIIVDGQTIILDAGSGIIPLGRELMQRHRGKSIEATIFFSHMHHDHTQGFRFFTPIHIPSTQLHIFGPQIYEHSPEEVLVHTMYPATFPLSFENLPAQRTLNSLYDKDVVSLKDGKRLIHRGGHPSIQLPDSGVVVRTMRSDTHAGGVMFYRIEWQGRTIVYATDTERSLANDHRLITFARGADLLIHDAQYTEEHYSGFKPGYPSTKGWGHSTPKMACDMARAAGVKQLALFHFEPEYDDKTIAEIERKARSDFSNTIAPYEGMKISFEPLSAQKYMPLARVPPRILWPTI